MFTTMSTRAGLCTRAEEAGASLGGILRADRLSGPRVKPGRLRLDLDRRRREALSREFGSRVTEHAHWLPPADLALLNWVYRSNRPLTELAATGVAPRWVLHRRLNRIVARVLSPTYRHVAMLLAVASEPATWPPQSTTGSEEAFTLAAARALFINGISVREVARELKCPRCRVTRLRAAVEAQAGAIAPTTSG